MDQQSTSAMLSDAPGEKESKKLVSEETILEPGGNDKTSGSKESSANDINYIGCNTKTRSEPAVNQTESLKDSKSDSILDNHQSSNTANDCKEAEVTVSLVIKEDCEVAQNIINKEEDSPLDNEKKQQRIGGQISQKEVLLVAADVPNENQETNGATTETPEVSEPKMAIPSSDSEITRKVDSTNETKIPKKTSSSLDTADGGIELQNASKSEEKNAKDKPIVVAAVEIAKEPISEGSKGEIVRTESTTETIEFNLIKYTEIGAEETTILNATVNKTIVQSNAETDSASSTAVGTENMASSDKNLSQNDKLPEIIDKNETCISINKKDTADSIVKFAEEEKLFNDEKTREWKESTCPEDSDSTSALPESPIIGTNDSIDSENPATSVASPTMQRSVIQDIFDDWRDENPEDECQQASKSHDSVEMELKILLDDDKPSEINYDENVTKMRNEQSFAAGIESKQNSGSIGARATIVGAHLESLGSKEYDKLRESFLDKETTAGQAGSRRVEKPNETTTPRDRMIRQKPLAPRPGVKVPGFLLTSPIVSKTAVSKVLKERLREQQKEFDAPVKPDIFFVKKITQRLSHKLAAASAAQIPGLVPLPHSAAKTDGNRMTKSPAVCEEKKASSVDKELLAILEGDVDPDWSNLKPPTLVQEIKNGPAAATEHNNPPKLDPLIERELALKQLLELPNSPAKKTVTKKTPGKTPKNKNTKVAKTSTPRSATKKEVSVELVETKSEESTIEQTEKRDSWDSVKPTMQELKIDETRSGRKRKPTEKAREHEQNSTKRLKVSKGRASVGKRSGNDSDQSQTNDPPPLTTDDGISKISTEITEEKLEIPVEIEATSEKRLNAPADDPPGSLKDSRLAESTRVVITKKVIANSSAKRKMPVGQKFIRQKMTGNKKTALGLKSKFPKGISKKTATKLISAKGQKQRNGENAAGEVKPKKKVINEIDRLLQDEGVVNLLYDVEQPRKKRLVPITKSQTKVMDLQKIQRELKIRTKLVRNAVLRLRTSNISTSKVSPRSKRSVSYNSDASLPEKKPVIGEHVKSGQSSVASAPDFIFPAKIRNAADASIIIRRHSSSSFSSASASPRASIDGPERLSLDSWKNEESGAHVLRSNKRLHSREGEEKNRNNKKKKPQQQSPEPKRNRRKAMEGPDPRVKTIDIEAVIAAATGGKNKATAGALSGDFSVATTARAAKKVETKKNAKSSKQQIEVIDIDETAGIKAATRSNGAGGGKIIPKSKKSIKGKVTFAKGSESFNETEVTQRVDELSACLAEVVTALTNDSGGPSRSRSTVPVNRYKTKGIASSVKTSETDGNKSKLESRVQFSNKEINVQRHGNLVQLLLTPSKTTKIRNGITLQVMQEIRENLSILKKDEDCRVVLLTSTGSSFCEGLELSTILHENKEERRIRAQELANGVKEFIKSLATFNKPIVAGVQGSAIGLGVTMLPWFDLVIASDKATFSTPYGKLGQIAEGAAIFTLSHILGSAVTSELLLGGRTLTASEALRAGLVTRVLWPDRFQAELLPSLRAMSEQSSQSMEATKALLRHSLRKKLDAALESESYLLVQHWCSVECQAAITTYVDEHIQ